MKISTGCRKFLLNLAVAAVWLIIWQLLCRAVGRELLLPSPLRVAERLWELVRDGQFWLSVGGSLLRILEGFLLGVALGALIAILTAKSRILYTFLAPMMNVIKATPVASFIILALVWLSTSKLPVFATMIMVLPMVWSSLYQGIINTDRKLLEMARVFRFSRGKTLRMIYFPSVKPHLLSACTTGVGFAWKAGVAAEVLAIPRGSIGYHIYHSKLTLSTADLFAWTAVVILLSILLERSVVMLVNALNRKEARADDGNP